MPLELYLRSRTSTTEDRRTGNIADGAIRLTAVDSRGKVLFAEDLADEPITLFVDELPSGQKRSKESSPERVVGDVPTGAAIRPAPELEGRPGLTKAARAPQEPAGAHVTPQDAPEDQEAPAAPPKAPRTRTGTRSAAPAARKARR